jgi:DNA polymerase-1
MLTNCEKCPLNGQPRLASGDGIISDASYIFVGEAPGATEIAQNRAFIGRAGQLLRQTLIQIKAGILNDCYFTNTCLCRPPANKTPTQQAVDACKPRLQAELTTATNKIVIIALGTTALNALLADNKLTITAAHGIPVYSEQYSCYVVATFHPAAVLRNGSLFRDLCNDIEFAITKVPKQKVDAVRVPSIHKCINQRQVSLAIQYLQAFTKVTALVCDIETTSLNAQTGKVLSVMMMADQQNAWVFTDDMMRLPIVKQFFEDRSILWAGHNASQFDGQFLKAKYNIDWYPRFDTLLAHYTIDERQGSHGLKALAQRRFFADNYGIEMKAAMKAGTLDQVDQNQLYAYQALDCYYTSQLIPELYNEMKVEHTITVHDDILIPLSHAFRDIELRGAKLDIAYLQSLQRTLQNELTMHKEHLVEQAKIYGMQKFNANSPKQVAELIYDHMAFTSKQRDTDRASLAVLKCDVADEILEYRAKAKLLNTYVDGLLQHVAADQRVHAEFLLFGTRTGRLSCQNPNLHNIPSFMTSSIIKKAFVATSNEWCIVTADFSQLELRIAAWLSKDQKLIDTFSEEGADFHRTVAAEMFNVPEQDVTERQRYIAKCVGFGILYGRSAKSLVEGWSLGKDPAADALIAGKWTVAMAQDYINRFLHQFADLNDWIKAQRKRVLQDYYIETPFGRRRRFAFISSENVAEVQRQAVNFSTQSTASDICQLALLKIHQTVDPNDAFIILTIHDSIILEVRKAVLSRIIPVIRQIMQTYPEQLEPRVPLKVDIDYGENWADMMSYKEDLI